jgi:hypothetical protein
MWDRYGGAILGGGFRVFLCLWVGADLAFNPSNPYLQDRPRVLRYLLAFLCIQMAIVSVLVAWYMIAYPQG